MLLRRSASMAGIARRQDSTRTRSHYAYFLALTGALGTIYWIPTFAKRLSGFSNQTVTSLLLIPALIGIAGMPINENQSQNSQIASVIV
jgi:ACS family tartrate transporter-like MFS transporter